jgi:DnaJ-domain-containing protein 1
MVAAFRVLLWLAECDGSMRNSELAALARIASRSTALLGCFAGAIEHSSLLTFRELRISFERVMALPFARRAPLLKAAIRVALADGELTPPEHHALRLVADACVGGVEGETALAAELASLGRRLQPPVDLSDPEWWTQQEARHSARKPPSGWGVASTLALREVRDLATLGLGPGADRDAIRSAFRRVVMMLHPDRLVDADDKTRAEASRMLQYAQEAHERLTTP